MILLTVLLAAVILYIPLCLLIKAVLIPLYDKLLARVNAYFESISPTPACAVKQQAVYDFYRNILKTGHNTRSEFPFTIQSVRHCSLAEAQLVLLQHDCDDAGLEMNFEYAASLTGYAFELSASAASADFINRTRKDIASITHD